MIEPKTIHLVGAQESNYPWGVECRIIRALENLGHKIISTDFRKNREQLPNLLMKPADLVIVCRGDGISPEAIESIPWPTALWYAELIGSKELTDGDAEFRRRQLAMNCHAFDYVFLHDGAGIEVCKELGGRNVRCLPTAAVDPSINCKLGLQKEFDITFVGSHTAHRKKFIQAIRSHFNVHTPNLWDMHELNILYNRSKIVLNIHLSALPNTETRLCEVIGAGAFLLSEALSMRDFLIDGAHFVSFGHDSVDDCLEKIGFYLTHAFERESIASEGYRHVTTKHTFEKRLEQLLGQIDFGRRKEIWPSYGLGFTFNAGGKPTFRLESFYEAVADSVRRLPISDSAAASTPGPHSSRSLRIFAAFSNVNWEDNNLQPALESFGEVIRFRWDFADQYRPEWHTTGKIRLNRELLNALASAHRERPIDLFFSYVSGRTVFPGTLRSIQLMGIPTLNLCLDDKTKFAGALEPTGHSGMIDIANAFTLCWTSTEDAIGKYRALGAKAVYLPAGANPQVFRPQDLPRDLDVSFIGQKYGRRPLIIETLRKSGIDVRAFGKGWESGEISQEEMIRIYSRSRITLGFAGVGDSDEIFCLKGRDFEVPMSGGFYLTQYHPELEHWFEIGKEIACYSNIDDLTEKIHYYLAHPEEAQEIRENGRRRALRDHTWAGRFEHVFRAMGVLPFSSGADNTLSKSPPSEPARDTQRLHAKPSGFSVAGYYGQRSWCRSNAVLISHLQENRELDMQGTRMWEYSFVLKKVLERPNATILDIGIGEGVFAAILARKGYRVTGVDNYQARWNDLKSTQAKTGIECIDADARNLHMFQEASFDIALLISMIEHVPSNTIWCEKRKMVKTGDMLKEENPEKRMVIDEALRVVKPGGMLILTSDIYLDYPPEMNISWRELLGIGGIDRENFNGSDDLFICDNPIHKGRVLPIAVTIEKSQGVSH